jgi:hypothetical protein
MNQISALLTDFAKPVQALQHLAYKLATTTTYWILAPHYKLIADIKDFRPLMPAR